jgi:alpha-tubulin suppressor-like RCC1 family protein
MNANKIVTAGLAAAAAVAALICACVNQPVDVARSNLYDPGGLNWHPPVVTVMMDTIVEINDSITITATGADTADGGAVKFVWANNAAIYSDTTDSGFLRVAWPDTGCKAVRVKAIDDIGRGSVPDTCMVTVMLDIPEANAGNDTGVSVSDTVNLHGSATDRLGHLITSWAWDIGNTGTFIATSSGDTTIVAPDSENLNYRCVLRVIDDEGNMAKDTVIILVHNWVKNMSAGGFHSLILKRDNTLWVCGYNYWGQLGDGTVTERHTPVKVMSGVQGISGGVNHSLILKTDGTLWACGANYGGQLGDGTNTDRSTPVQMASDVQSMAAGGYHSFVLKTDGTLWACGDNENGQLGDGTTTSRNRLVQVMKGVQNIQSMAAGLYHSLVLTSEGNLWACGWNGGGQLCDGTTNVKITLEQVMSGVQGIAAGGESSFIIKSDGSLWGCGRNDYGQMGVGNTSNQFTPARIMSNVKSAAPMIYHTLILKSDNTLWACGRNDYGQLGDGTWTARSLPVRVMSNVKAMSAGWDHSLFLANGDTLLACGANYNGQLGDGTTTSRITPVRIIP